MRITGVLFLIFTILTGHAETLNIVTPSFSPPFVMSTDNQKHFIGFSVDIITNICKQLKATCRIKSLPFEQTFDAVIRNEADLAIGNYTISSNREAYVQFSLPYLDSMAAMVTLSSNDVTSIKDLKHKRIGAETDSVFIHYLAKQFGNDIQIVSYPSIAEMMFALNDGSVDAIMFDRETANFWIGNNYDMFKIVGEPFALGEGIGIMVNKDNHALLARLNQALTSMKSDGSYTKIYHTYFN